MTKKEAVKYISLYCKDYKASLPLIFSYEGRKAILHVRNFCLGQFHKDNITKAVGVKCNFINPQQ